MASSCGSGGSSGSPDQDANRRRQKRMLSNRESARRSRVRKQKHMDDMMVQVAQLRRENSGIVTALNITAQRYLNVEAENSVLRAQMMELGTRLDSLNQMMHCMNVGQGRVLLYDSVQDNSDGFTEPWYMSSMNQLPIMASADFQYC